MRRRTTFKNVAARTAAASLAVMIAFLTPSTGRHVEAAKSISEIEAQQQQVQSELNALDGDLVKVVGQMTDTQQEIDQNQQDIADTEENIQEAQASCDQQYADMKARMKSMYESGQDNNSMLAMIAESGSITELINRVEYSNQVYTYDRDLLGSYQATLEEVQNLKDSLEQEKASLKTKQSELAKQQASLNTLISSKKGEANDLSAQLEEAKRLEAERIALEKKRQEEAAARQRAAVEAAAKKAAQEQAARQAAQRQQAASTKNNTAAAVTKPSKSNNTTAATTTPSTSTNSNTGSTTGGGSTGGTSKPAQPTNTTTASNPSGSSIVAYATSFVGNNYVWGGTSLTNGCDCSGFVGQVMAHFGLLSQSAANAHGYTSGSLRGVGKAVSVNDMQPGDIVCYSGHVAIYAGGGVIVEAQSPRAGITFGRSVYNKPILAVRRLGV